MMPGDLLTYGEAAERLTISTRTLRTLVAAGKVPHYRLGPDGGIVRFTPAHLAAYLECCEHAGPHRRTIREGKSNGTKPG